MAEEKQDVHAGLLANGADQHGDLAISLPVSPGLVSAGSEKLKGYGSDDSSDVDEDKFNRAMKRMSGITRTGTDRSNSSLERRASLLSSSSDWDSDDSEIPKWRVEEGLSVPVYAEPVYKTKTGEYGGGATPLTWAVGGDELNEVSQKRLPGGVWIGHVWQDMERWSPVKSKDGVELLVEISDEGRRTMDRVLRVKDPVSIWSNSGKRWYDDGEVTDVNARGVRLEYDCGKFHKWVLHENIDAVVRPRLVTDKENVAANASFVTFQEYPGSLKWQMGRLLTEIELKDGRQMVEWKDSKGVVWRKPVKHKQIRKMNQAETWDINDVIVWLKGLKLDQATASDDRTYSEKFREFGMDGPKLMAMTRSRLLHELEIHSAHVKKMMAHIERMRINAIAIIAITGMSHFLLDDAEIVEELLLIWKEHVFMKYAITEVRFHSEQIELTLKCHHSQLDLHVMRIGLKHVMTELLEMGRHVNESIIVPYTNTARNINIRRLDLRREPVDAKEEQENRERRARERLEKIQMLKARSTFRNLKKTENYEPYVPPEPDGCTKCMRGPGRYTTVTIMFKFWLFILVVWIIQFVCGVWLCASLGFSRKSFMGAMLTQIVFAGPLSIFALTDDVYPELTKKSGPWENGKQGMEFLWFGRCPAELTDSCFGVAFITVMLYLCAILMSITLFMVIAYTPFFWPVGLVPQRWADYYDLVRFGVARDIDVRKSWDTGLSTHKASDFNRFYFSNGYVRHEFSGIYMNKWCVAPVLADNSTHIVNATQVYYWAVCDLSGWFPGKGIQKCIPANCDKWASSQRTGLLVNKLVYGERYTEAIMRSPALPNHKGFRDPIFVEWGVDFDARTAALRHQSIYITLIFVFILSIVSLFVTMHFRWVGPRLPPNPEETCLYIGNVDVIGEDALTIYLKNQLTENNPISITDVRETIRPFSRHTINSHLATEHQGDFFYESLEFSENYNARDERYVIISCPSHAIAIELLRVLLESRQRLDFVDKNVKPARLLTDVRHWVVDWKRDRFNRQVRAFFSNQQVIIPSAIAVSSVLGALYSGNLLSGV